MSYHVARTITRILSGLVLLIMYLLYVVSRFQAGSLLMDELQAWARLMLVVIGIAIVAGIVLEILFHILFSIGVAVKESIANGQCSEEEIEKSIQQDMVEDEMAKLIGLKSMRVSFVITVIGFFASLFSLLLGYPAFIMINIVFVSFFIAGISDGCTRLYYYKRGV
ncbi:hypothetical protein [Spirochaeta dissipatitropha]